MASLVFRDLFGIVDLQEPKRRILASAKERSTATPRQGKLFQNVAPRD